MSKHTTDELGDISWDKREFIDLHVREENVA